MKKLVTALLGIVAGASLLCACGKKDVVVDVTALGDSLATQIEYQDELNAIDSQMASMFINLSSVNIVNSAIYEGSGATAEEIVVLECESADEANVAKEALEQRVNEQVESFTDYVPAELEKLNNKVIRVSGKYVVLSVSDDSQKANKIIDEYFK